MTWRELSTELKVGLFVLVTAAVIAFGWVWSYDGLRRSEGGYHVQMVVPSADGLYPGSLVKIAGVEVGAIDAVTVEGNRARLVMTIKSDYPIPTDTKASLKSSGMLGDRYVGLDLGTEEANIPDGGTLELAGEPYDIDAIAGQLEDVTDDVKAITAVLRETVENDANREHLEASLANIDALSAELRLMAEQNQEDVAAIVDNVNRLTTHLDELSVQTAADLDAQFESLATATKKLDGTLENLESITGKIDDGEGTLGALVNDDATLTAINETVDNANAAIETWGEIRGDAYYLGRVFVGSQPDDPAFYYGNPAAPATGSNDVGYADSHNLGVALYLPNDFWGFFEVNDYPQGLVRSEEQLDPDTGASVTVYTRSPRVRLTFMMAKRWWDVSFRLCIKESSGGVGVTGHLFRNHLTLSADVFDFEYGSYPAIDDSGLPNLRLAARLEPIPRLWLEAGMEQVLLGARYGYATGFVGAGFHITARDVKRRSPEASGSL